MRQIFAFETKDDHEKYEDVVHICIEKLKTYQAELEKNYVLTELPKGIVWTTMDLATTAFSNLPIPAFTSRDLIFLSPDLESWRTLFLTQLEDRTNQKVKTFYENLSLSHIVTILGHELTHHSDLFIDEFDDDREDSIWFEEGMCVYLPRKMMLSPAEFEAITSVERELIGMFQDKYGARSLDDFGSASYGGSLTSIMFDYWRSFFAVKYLVEEWADHDVKKVFAEYHRWQQEGKTKPLTEHFNITSPI